MNLSPFLVPLALASAGGLAGCARQEYEGVCPAGTVLVPGGKFEYGHKHVTGRATEEDIAAFCIDRYEFPNREGERPKTDVTWLEAASACRALGKRLCTEYEWEKACRGRGGLVFPWGNAFDRWACALSPEEAAAHTSGRLAGCVSAYGVWDMAGSVWEWTSTAWEGDPERRLVRGGWEEKLGEFGASCAYRAASGASRATGRIGFRCCKSPERGWRPGTEMEP